MVARYADGTELHISHPKGFYAGGGLSRQSRPNDHLRNRFTAFPPDLVAAAPDPEVAAVWGKEGFVARPTCRTGSTASRATPSRWLRSRSVTVRPPSAT